MNNFLWFRHGIFEILPANIPEVDGDGEACKGIARTESEPINPSFSDP
jgi:hypothetical protein